MGTEWGREGEGEGDRASPKWSSPLRNPKHSYVQGLETQKNNNTAVLVRLGNLKLCLTVGWRCFFSVGWEWKVRHTVAVLLSDVTWKMCLIWQKINQVLHGFRMHNYYVFPVNNLNTVNQNVKQNCNSWSSPVLYRNVAHKNTNVFRKTSWFRENIHNSYEIHWNCN